MARVRTVDFLPEIFQTPANKQFLAATLDQLVQEPKFKKTQGWIGRKVGPGVTPTDQYVVEPTATRENYQLEPGVVMLDPNNSKKVMDAITYPGINDAIRSQGGYTDNAQSLYTSEYYAFDPFIDFDKFANYSQYYWLPLGPDTVNVSATQVPTSNTFKVTRGEDSYAFSGVGINNPNLTLVRGGSYEFDIYQPNVETITYRVTNLGTVAWVIDYENNPTLTLVRGNTYNFNLILSSSSLPFWIKTKASTGVSYQYNNGVFNNGALTGQVTFTVPVDAPDTLYYACGTQANMSGTLTIVDAPENDGPKFWIQAAPGVDGRIPVTPNISSRTVLGVTNNGIDGGTVTFNVPLKDAQRQYYDMTDRGSVDLITSLQWNQINGAKVTDFLQAYGSIDGITNLENRTIAFSQAQTTPDTWNIIWKIVYVPDLTGTIYIQLVEYSTILNDEKFSVGFGNVYASTNWYRETGVTVFQQIPLLTASQDTLYYQDGNDPRMVGSITLVDDDLTAFIDVNDILGKKNYTSPNGVTFTNGLKIVFRGNTVPESYENNEYFVDGVGSSIVLLPFENYLAPLPYIDWYYIPYDSTPYDSTPYDATNTTPYTPEYLTISRNSMDLNPWTRTNRWFHSEVIAASAAYNGVEPTYTTSSRGRRPILEFRGNLRLFNFGTKGLPNLSAIDFSQTNALLNVNGQTSYEAGGFELTDGSTVIFAADADPNVRNQIYTVNFIQPDSVPPLIAEPYIELVPTNYSPAQVDECVLVFNGLYRGDSYVFDGSNWILTQQKTAVQQAPLFDVYDNDGFSLANKIVYPSSSFEGCKLFSYAIDESSVVDDVLGFPLSFFQIGIVGDILFDNNLYTDTFTYTKNNSGNQMNVSEGFVRQYTSRTDFFLNIGWQTAPCKSQTRQQFQFQYTGQKNIELDVAVGTLTPLPVIQLFVDNIFQETSTYTYVTTSNTTTISLLLTYPIDSKIEILVLSDQVSKSAFYEVPKNLENNPLNGNSPQFTQGTIRQHYNTIAENLVDLVGPVNGPNNIRDLGNVVPYGEMILQQSSPLTLAGFFYRSATYNIFESLSFNSREYSQYKDILLNTVVNNDYGIMTVPEILDTAMAQINAGKTNLNSFYWSDMVPYGTPLASNTYVISPITQPTFNTVQTYSFTESNFKAVLVYKNDELLTRGPDYVVPPNTAKVTILTQLNLGDSVTVVEYNNTTGNFVPNTPTKMGMWAAYEPVIFTNPNYISPVVSIRGHDGSVTVAFGDIRDEILLEFERRIYNNIKMDNNPNPLLSVEVIPGFFRKTDYTHEQIQDLLNEDFLAWVGWNKISYQTQYFDKDNQFTYNYSGCANKLNDQVLPGAWRGINNYFYDCLDTNLRPWEMLGFSIQPDWWETVYGPAPYTSGNTVLWEDLEAGWVADPAGGYVIPYYIRPGLLKVIPNGDQGELLPPTQTVVGLYDSTSFKKSWAPGDGGPSEAAWYTSSYYPFAVMRLLAMTRPAEFFSLYADRDLYRYDTTLNQYLYNGRYRLDAKDLTLYGSGVSKASFINWIIDYNQQLGINSSSALQDSLNTVDVRLCYRMASFTQLSNLDITLERSSPQSNNQSLQIPQDDVNLVLYENQPFDESSYSGVVIQIVNGGYSVYGYSSTRPYFIARASQFGGQFKTISAGNITVSVPSKFSDNYVKVPYGHVFETPTLLVDFLLGYGRYLEDNGYIFDDYANGYVLGWEQMAREFLYFTGQGWSPDTIINLNPAAGGIRTARPEAVVFDVESITPGNMILDQNRQLFPSRNLIIQRNGNEFQINPSPETQQTISYLDLKFTQFEDLVVFNNVTVFQDLVYDPITSLRQTRMMISAITSLEWDGTIDAQGFILNQNNVAQWDNSRRYAKGEMVIYKNLYWQAMGYIQPSERFDFSKWASSNYTKIQQGLLPNLATKADQLAQAYNTQIANLNKDEDLLAFNLIGFNPRKYMADLDLQDTSQISLYQNFIPYVGTSLSAELFKNVRLNRFRGDYQIFENWAIKSGVYGASANKRFVEIQTDQSLLTNNPSTIQISDDGLPTGANQTVPTNQLWSESYYITDADIFPTIYPTTISTALPSAGYVDLDDVDVTVYSLSDPKNIEASIDSLGVGSIIWVAHSNSYDWNIYRCGDTPGLLVNLVDNLDGTSNGIFNNDHGLSKADLIVIRFYNDDVNGVYRVLAVPNPYTITIAYQFTNRNQTNSTGSGIVLTLQTARVAQPSDIANLPFVTALGHHAKVWVDNDGNGHWQVLQKQDTITDARTLATQEPVYDSRYGADVAQSFNHIAAIAGAPELDVEGGLFTFVRDDQTNYVAGPVLRLGTPETLSYGHSVNFGYQNWAVAGAPLSKGGDGYAVSLYIPNNSTAFRQTQILLSPYANSYVSNSRFGTSVEISQDEQWLYVGAPGERIVYAYGKVNVEEQVVEYVGDNSNRNFVYSDNIKIDPSYPLQLSVFVNDENITGDPLYTVSSTSVIFAAPPELGDEIRIERRQFSTPDFYVYTGITQTSTSGSGSGAQFTVINRRGVYYVKQYNNNGGSGYIYGDTITIDGSQLQPGGSSANNLVITVTDIEIPGTITDFTYSGSGIGNTATFSVRTTLYTATSIEAFSVYVNNALYRPDVDYTFDSVAGTFTFVSGSIPPAGDMISVFAESYWTLSGRMEAPIDVLSDFGTSISTNADGSIITIGAPSAEDEADDVKDTTVVFHRSSQATMITDITQMSYTVVGTVSSPVFVTIGNTNITPAAQAWEDQPQFTLSGSTLTLENVNLEYGSELRVQTNQFSVVQKIVAPKIFNDTTPKRLSGASVSTDSYGAEVYIGQPHDGNVLIQSGSVARYTNAGLKFGTITAGAANPTIQANATISINEFLVTVPVAPNNTLSGLANVITTTVPNVTGSVSPDLTIYADGQTNSFYVGDIYSSAVTYTPIIKANGITLSTPSEYFYDNSNQMLYFVNTPAYGTVITVVSGRLIISVTNPATATENDLLLVAPGLLPALYDTLAFRPYVFTQTIVSPYPTTYAYFGASVDIDSNGLSLVVGSPNGTVFEPMMFDGNKTYFDDYSTSFFTAIPNSGVVFTYNLLSSISPSIDNPGLFVFGQQVFDKNMLSNTDFGFSASYVNERLLIGAPGRVTSNPDTGNGRVSAFRNPRNLPAWNIIHEQQPVVNVQNIESVYTYSAITPGGTQTYIDVIDPLQGKILGVAARNIDYTGAVDPAQYNVGPIHNNGNSWAREHVGEIWWDTDTVRFLNPNQSDLSYSSKQWAQVFPGSTIDVYQWVESTTIPSEYTGQGSVLSTETYTSSIRIDSNGTLKTYYYFWVKGSTVTNTDAGKTLSTNAIALYIGNPMTSGLPYMAALNSRTVALYNVGPLLSATDTILHIGFEQEISSNNVHLQYDLIADGQSSSFLSVSLYNKLIDSFAGINQIGYDVPDMTLPYAMRAGTSYRPRQSMFLDRYAALENYLTAANTIMAQYPIVEMRNYSLLKSAQAAPNEGSGEWDKSVANLTELSYQDIYAVPAGYRYLVLNDSQYNGEWTIYQVQIDSTVTGLRDLVLIQIQNYDTNLYWNYTDWYRAGFSSSTKPYTSVRFYSDLSALPTLPAGTVIKVQDNGFSGWELYELQEDNTWLRVALQDGTIQIDSSVWNYTTSGFGFDANVFDGPRFDQSPQIETRYIIRALNEQIFSGELEVYRNNLLILMFNYIFTEQQSPDWLMKTSFIDVEHNIGDLIPSQIYFQGNQNFVLDYINEVKPYHTVIRNFDLTYSNDETVLMNGITDFDCPAFWDTSLPAPQFISPILTPYSRSDSLVESFNSDVEPGSSLWTTTPWNYWFDNYHITLLGVTLSNKGRGYTSPPSVTAVGDAEVPAVLQATINTLGQVTSVIVVNPGSGYTVTPEIVFELPPIGGIQAAGRAVMANQFVRDTKVTVRFDRCEYTTNVIQWEEGVSYPGGTMVRHLNGVWKAIVEGTYTYFNVSEWTFIPAADLNGADRSYGYYQPGVSMPGLSLPLLIDGVDYPGVQITGLAYADVIGFDEAPFDTFPFNADEVLRDANYFGGTFLNTTLGTLDTDVNVYGGNYINTFNSHAPEELIPGYVYDSVNIRVIDGEGLETSNFSIFQDMKGIPTVYRHVPGICTLVGDITAEATSMVVSDPYMLTQPDFYVDSNWGVVFIGGERIMYRSVDIATSTVSGMMRGTGGTGASAHVAGTEMFNESWEVRADDYYQNFITSSSSMGNGTNRTFVAPNINLAAGTPTYAIRLLVGGIELMDHYVVNSISPASVTINTPIAPPVGVEVTLAVYQANSWNTPH